MAALRPGRARCVARVMRLAHDASARTGAQQIAATEQWPLVDVPLRAHPAGDVPHGGLHRDVGECQSSRQRAQAG